MRRWWRQGSRGGAMQFQKYIATTTREVPIAEQAECGLIGAILRKPEWLAVSREELTPDDFSLAYNRAAFRAFIMLADRGDFVSTDQRVAEPNLIAGVIRGNGD